MWLYSYLLVMVIYVSLWGLQTMRAKSFLNFISLVIKEKDEFIFSLESATSIQKPRNLLKVACHPVSCLLHHYTNQEHHSKNKQIFFGTLFLYLAGQKQ